MKNHRSTILLILILLIGLSLMLYPSFAVIIDDIYNPIFLSIFAGIVA